MDKDRDENAKAATPDGPMTNAPLRVQEGSNRQSARALLEDVASRHERQARQLRELSLALPLRLPPLADEALWSLLVQAR